MILTKILLDFWDSPENILFQKNNFYILFHDIFKKGWFIICFVSSFQIYRDFKWKWVRIEEKSHIPWVSSHFLRKVRVETNYKMGCQGCQRKVFVKYSPSIEWSKSNFLLLIILIIEFEYHPCWYLMQVLLL